MTEITIIREQLIRVMQNILHVCQHITAEVISKSDDN